MFKSALAVFYFVSLIIGAQPQAQAQENETERQWEVVSMASSQADVERPHLEVELHPIKNAEYAEKAEASLVRELVGSAHEIIEGPETGNFIKDWKEAFNLRRIFLDGRRWFSSNKGSPMENLAFSLIMSIGMSHSLETSSGFVALAVGTANNWPAWVTSLTTTIGGIISTPGLDPLCMAVVGMYFVSPQFRNFMGFVRLAVVKTAEGVWRFSGANAAFRHFFERPDYKVWATTQVEHLENLREFRNNELIARYSFPNSTAPELRLEISLIPDERPRLYQVHVSRNITLQAVQQAEPWLNKLGYNGKDFVIKFIKQVVTAKESTIDPSRWRWNRLRNFIESEGEMKTFMRSILREYSAPNMEFIFGSFRAYEEHLKELKLWNTYIRSKKPHLHMDPVLLEEAAREFILGTQKKSYVEELSIRVNEEWSSATLKGGAIPVGPSWQPRRSCVDIFKRSSLQMVLKNQYGISQ